MLYKTVVFLLAVAALALGCAKRQAMDQLDADDYYLNLVAVAGLQEEDNDLRGAIRSYKQAVKLNPGSALLHMLIAHDFYLLGNDTLAVHYGRKAVRLEPENADNRLVLGNGYLIAKDLDPAIEQYREAYRLRPTSNILLTLTGLYEGVRRPDSAVALLERRLGQEDDPDLRRQLASLLARTRRWAEARDQYRLLVTGDSANASAVAALAGLNQVLGQPDSALFYYARAEFLEPANRQLKVRIFNLLLELKDHRAAIAQAQDILALDPNDASIRLQLARLLYFLPDPPKAEAQFQALADMDSTNTEALYTAAKLKLQRKQYAEALTYFQRTVRLLPKVAEAWYNIGLCHLALGRPDSSLEFFKLSRKHGNRQEVDYMFGVGYSSLDEYATALPYYQRLYDDKRKDPSFLFNYAAALERTGAFDKAVEAFRQLLRRDPANASAQNYLGYMFAEHGQNLDEAKVLIEMALAAEPDNAYYIDSMGWVYFQLGRIEEARASLERAVELMPGDATLRDHLGDIYRALGLGDKALEQWRKALELDPKKDDVRKKIDGQTPGR